jgi:hypothetical protein
MSKVVLVCYSIIYFEIVLQFKKSYWSINRLIDNLYKINFLFNFMHNQMYDINSFLMDITIDKNTTKFNTIT